MHRTICSSKEIYLPTSQAPLHALFNMLPSVLRVKQAGPERRHATRVPERLRRVAVARKKYYHEVGAGTLSDPRLLLQLYQKIPLHSRQRILRPILMVAPEDQVRRFLRHNACHTCNFYYLRCVGLAPERWQSVHHRPVSAAPVGSGGPTCTCSHLCRIERGYVASCRVKSGELQKSLAAVRDVPCGPRT